MASLTLPQFLYLTHERWDIFMNVQRSSSKPAFIFYRFYNEAACVYKFSGLCLQILVKILDIKFHKIARSRGFPWSEEDRRTRQSIRIFCFSFSTADQQRTSKDKQLIPWTWQQLKQSANTDVAFNMRLTSLCLVFFNRKRKFKLIFCYS